MSPWAWLTIASLCVSGAMSPGPSLAVVVKNTVDGGRAQGVATGVGHGIGVGLYAFGAVAGFSALVRTVPTVERALTLGGGVYLLWLGANALWALRPSSTPDPETQGPVPAPERRGFAEGFLTAFLNPKIAVFFLALLGSFVPEGAGLTERTGVAALALGIDMGWYVLVAVALATTGAAGWLAGRSRVVGGFTGVLLVAAGVAVIAGGAA